MERKGKDFICCLAPGSSANCRIAAPAKLDGYIALSTGGRVGQSTSSDGGHCGSPYGASCATCNPPGPVGEDKACCWNQINGCESQCNPVIPGVNIAEGGTNNPSWWCPTQVIMQGWCSVNAEGQDSWWFCKGTVDTNGLNFSFNNLTVGSRTFQVTGVPLGYTCNYTFTIEGINKSGTGCTFSQELKANNYLMVVLVPPGKISGNVYKNTTGLTCNTGSLQSGRTVTIAGTGGSTYACSLTTNGSGYYDSDSCSSKPPRGSSYTVSVSHNATDESCLSCGGSSCSQSVSLAAAPSITQNFTVFPLKNAWFQTGYGDVHGNGGVGATMPIDTCTSATCTAGGCCPYLSLGTANTAGVVSTGGNFTGNVETKNLFSNPNNWKVKDAATENFTGFGGNQTKYDYVRFSAKLQNCVTEDKENFFNPGHFKDLGKDPGGNCYKFSPGGAGTSYRGNTRTVASDQKIIILVDGDITFNPLIKVTPGGFFALISSGNITFDTGIGSSTPLNPASSAASQMQGIYIADGSIDTSVSTNQFLGGGMFIADANLDGTGSLNFNRNLDSGGTNYNNSYPSEYFEYRPDFLVNFPVNFGFNRLTWQEVAP
ncbi:MAG: hypothetical protein M1575_03875 [Patescibacteria group bacterium]|nr:hypothetical protein [Patescibacteria group bacterium]MCL5095831.1 hypothetical protein [Patescibacteria group bacterium]